MIPVVFALKEWHLLLLWCAMGGVSQWMRSLEVVNEDAWTFEQLVLWRFDEIDYQLRGLTGKPLPAYLRTNEAEETE